MESSQQSSGSPTTSTTAPSDTSTEFGLTAPLTTSHTNLISALAVTTTLSPNEYTSTDITAQSSGLSEISKLTSQQTPVSSPTPVPLSANTSTGPITVTPAIDKTIQTSPTAYATEETPHLSSTENVYSMPSTYITSVPSKPPPNITSEITEASLTGYTVETSQFSMESSQKSSGSPTTSTTAPSDTSTEFGSRAPLTTSHTNLISALAVTTTLSPNAYTSTDITDQSSGTSKISKLTSQQTPVSSPTLVPLSASTSTGPITVTPAIDKTIQTSPTAYATVETPHLSSTENVYSVPSTYITYVPSKPPPTITSETTEASSTGYTVVTSQFSMESSQQSSGSPTTSTTAPSDTSTEFGSTAPLTTAKESSIQTTQILSSSEESAHYTVFSSTVDAYSIPSTTFSQQTSSETAQTTLSEDTSIKTTGQTFESSKAPDQTSVFSTTGETIASSSTTKYSPTTIYTIFTSATATVPTTTKSSDVGVLSSSSSTTESPTTLTSHTNLISDLSVMSTLSTNEHTSTEIIEQSSESSDVSKIPSQQTSGSSPTTVTLLSYTTTEPTEVTSKTDVTLATGSTMQTGRTVNTTEESVHRSSTENVHSIASTYITSLSSKLHPTLSSETTDASSTGYTVKTSQFSMESSQQSSGSSTSTAAPSVPSTELGSTEPLTTATDRTIQSVLPSSTESFHLLPSTSKSVMTNQQSTTFSSTNSFTTMLPISAESPTTSFTMTNTNNVSINLTSKNLLPSTSESIKSPSPGFTPKESVSPPINFRSTTIKTSTVGPTYINASSSTTKYFSTTLYSTLSAGSTASASMTTANSVSSSESTSSTVIAATMKSCTDCQCNGSPCFLNMTSGLCQCNCTDFTYGDSCGFGTSTTPVIFSEERPTRNAIISLKIIKDYISDYDHLNSEASKNLISIISPELSDITRKADAINFRDLKITRLLKGSIIVQSIAQYNYPNNQSQILFLNKDLETSLMTLFNNPDSLKRLGEALGNVSVQDPEVQMQEVELGNILDLKPYINCNSNIANYTLKIVDDAWVCEGPCQTNPDYCSTHGECVNEKNGPMCLCYMSTFQEYYGLQCELFRRGAGFYAALFGSLGAVLLVIIMTIVIAVVRMRSRRVWSLSSCRGMNRSALFTDYFFDFSDRGQLQEYTPHENLREAEDGSFRACRGIW